MVDALKKLNEYRRLFRLFLSIKPQPLVEHVTEMNKLLLNEDAKAVDGAIERVDDELGEGRDLASSV